MLFNPETNQNLSSRPTVNDCIVTAVCFLTSTVDHVVLVGPVQRPTVVLAVVQIVPAKHQTNTTNRHLETTRHVFNDQNYTTNKKGKSIQRIIRGAHMIKNYGPELVPLNLNILNFRPVKKRCFIYDVLPRTETKVFVVSSYCCC